ncbi:hypothetical protein HK105_208903 [Polyrhizophydium stewartii]|uniref:Uncharacterized protein n=1 Tax=Polyrhizophydium stewartii TaxID=2732419 RepID=A0ABR4MWM4_9FUNG
MSDLLEALAELAARVDAAVHSLHTLEGGGEASESDLPAQVAALSDAFEQKQSQYAVSSEAEQQLETLAALVRVLRELDRFDQFLSAGELVGASVSLRELEERIDRQSALHFQLTDVFREAFQFKDGHRLSAPSLQVASRITDTLIDRLKVVSAFASNHMFTASFPPPNAFVLRFAQGVFEVITHAVTTAVLGVADDTGVDLTQQALESMQEELESKGLWTAACPSLARFAATLPRRHMAARTNQIVSSITQILETIEGNVVRAPDILQHSLLGQLGLSSAAASVKGAMQGKSGKAQAHLVQHEFATRGFRISQQALLLAEAVSERLDGLASNDKQQEGGSEAAHVLQATKNIVEMFRATVLLDVDGSDVATHSPLRAMTVYCDCIFLSRFLGLLNARIHRVLSRETDSVMFSDLIPLFRRTGETLLLAHLVS